MRKLANLKGVRALNRVEQKSISGGAPGLGSSTCCDPANDCCTYVGGSGCQYDFADPNYPGYPFYNTCI